MILLVRKPRVDSVRMNNFAISFKATLKSIRLPFLILTPACLFLGWSVVIAGQVVDMHLLILSLLGAVLAHISVNTLNEYLDFKSGLDFKTKKTNFSGGSGALLDAPEMAKPVLIVGVISLAATVIIGLFFVLKYGWEIIPLGIMGLLLIIAYTRWINKHPFLCLVTPGIGFGFIMVLGANFALTGEYYLPLLIISLIPFFLVNNLLLLNQYPDIEADRAVGRNHFPIAYGVDISNLIYCLFIVLTIIVIVGSIIFSILPILSLIVLLPMLLAFFSLSGAMKYKGDIGSYPQYLAANVMVAILSPILLGLSIIYG